MRIEHRHPAATTTQKNRALAADNLHPHSLAATFGKFPRIKKSGDTALKREISVNAIAGNRPHRLIRLLHITDFQLSSFVRYMRRHPIYIADKKPHHIEQMRAQHDHILPTAAPILLSMCIDRLHLTNPPRRQYLLYMLYARQIRTLMRHRDLFARRLRLRHDLITVGQVPSHRLLAIHMRPDFQAGHYHLQMIVGPPRPHRDDLRLLFSQHLPPIGIGLRRRQFSLFGQSVFLALICNRYDLNPLVMLQTKMQPMPPIAPTGPTDGRAPIDLITITHSHCLLEGICKISTCEKWLSPKSILSIGNSAKSLCGNFSVSTRSDLPSPKPQDAA